MAELSARAELVAALSELVDPKKEGHVRAGQRDYRFLELPDLLSEVRTKFSAHGWAVMQPVQVRDGQVAVTNVWIHRSGEEITHPEFTLFCGRSPQEVGSAITYARRYSLAALVGLSGSDDDDAAALQTTPQSTTEVRAPQRTQQRPQRPQEPPREETRAEPSPQPDNAADGRLITPAQMKMLSALIGNWEKREGRKLDAEQRRGMIAYLAGIDRDSLGSAKDLTRDQASTAISELTRALEEPQEPSEEAS